MKLLCLSLIALTAIASLAQDTSHHRAVYEAVNKMAESAKPVAASCKDAELTWSLKAWSDETGIRKILARVDGEDGDGSDELYLEGGKLLFVFRQYTGADGKKVENRCYFSEGKMILWLGPDKKPLAKDDGFKSEATTLTGNCAKFLKTLGGKGTGKSTAGKDKAVALKTTAGTFQGIEEGDYSHWRLKTAAGKEITFFILSPDDSVDKVLKKPESYIGKKCSVKWKTTKEKIPEAGGVMDVEQIVSVEWVK